MIMYLGKLMPSPTKLCKLVDKCDRVVERIRAKMPQKSGPRQEYLRDLNKTAFKKTVLIKEKQKSYRGEDHETPL